MLILITIGAFLATLCGGLFALRLKDRLHLILGFSAGAIVGVAFFDLIPEALELASTAHSEATILALTALGFLIYLVLDRAFFMHSHDAEDEHSHKRGKFGAGSLSFHSFLDGIGIGLAFQISPAVGLIVAAAVLTHDFSDGINTVNLILKNGGSRTQALKWLAVDALAPVAGVLSTMFFHVPEETLGLLLALFAGFFLYIGASDLIPESHHAHPNVVTTIMTVVGVGTLFVAVRLAGI
ncbi:MAG: ZIP family metal transporter [Patescibacteria group bacterium]